MNTYSLRTTTRFFKHLRPKCQSVTVTRIGIGIRKLSSYPVSLTARSVSIETLAANLEIAIRSLHHDGLAVVKDAYFLQAKKGDSPFTYNPGNIQQDAPPVKEWFDERIFMKPSQHK
ncbi:uncharacterized protein BDV17DRAFT_291172 [Aspergillus undulatus]|uniref:uncharacterized protein n=1 Tax=Aspergillus undulatus TaxID=1810928 RepID=UPI003CCD1F0E